MSSYKTWMTLPAPVAQVIPAAVHAANAVGVKVKEQGPFAMKCKSGLTFTTYLATIEVGVSGVDGAAVVNVYARNFGFGPLQGGGCRDRATQVIDGMCDMLQSWTQPQGAQATPPAAPGFGR
jgi:hypothetical protein